MQIVICSESTWLPRIRREHAVPESAAADGHAVVFVEKARDARTLLNARSRREWLRGWRDRSRVVNVPPRIRFVRHSTLVPGHRASTGQWADARRRGATLSRIEGIEQSVVAATQPWQMPAVAAVPATEWRPDWSAELVGECQYAGKRSGPGPELLARLETTGGRVYWRDAIKRSELAGVLDRPQVLTALHRPGFSAGQNSTKLYEYAARGRPIVCTRGALGASPRLAAAGTVEARTPEQFAEAASASTAGRDRPAAVAASHTWDARWPTWARAAPAPEAA